MTTVPYIPSYGRINSAWVDEQRLPTKVLSPEDYGCNADGDDNAAGLLAAWQAATAEGAILDGNGKTYSATSQLVIPPNARLWMRNIGLQVTPATPVTVTGGTNLVSQSNTPWQAVGVLTADALRGSRVLSLNSADGLAVGKRLVIWSNKEMTGYLGPYSRASDYSRIASVDGNTVTLFTRLRTDFKVSDGAAVMVVGEDGGLNFENVTIIGSGAGKSERGLTSEYGYKHNLINCQYLNLERSGVSLQMCMYGHMRGLRYEATLTAEQGYGAAIGSCFGFDIGDVDALGARHAVTLAAPSATVNRLSGRDIFGSNVKSLEAGGTALDQHPGAPHAVFGNVLCSMREDADTSSPAVFAQGGGLSVGHVRVINGSTGGVGFQCLGWYDYAGHMPTLHALSIDGNAKSGMVSGQNRTNKGGLAGGHKLRVQVDRVGGDWDFGIRALAYDGDVEIEAGSGAFTCATKAVYLQSSTVGKPVVNLTGIDFVMTSATVTPIIIQGTAYAMTHPGELGGELNWRRGSFMATRKEIVNYRGIVRADDLRTPPNTSILQDGGQASSPVYSWTADGLLRAFGASDSGVSLANSSSRFSIGPYPVAGFPRLGFKTMTGTAAPDGSLINTEALTLPAGTAVADGSALNIASITATDANLRAVLAFVKANAAENQKNARMLKAVLDAFLAHGLVRFTDVLPPVNTVAPVISGLPAVGQVLTVTQGTWTNTPTGYTHQWYRDAAAIAGETGTTYTQVSGDVGKLVTCQEVASNTGGAGVAVASNGIPTGRPYNTVAPVVSYSDLNVGSTLSCSTGTWLNAPTGYAYQWYRGLAILPGATASTHVIAIDDDGTLPNCIVTATNANGSFTAGSNSVGPIDAGWTLRDMPGIVEWGYADYLANGAVAAWTGVIVNITPTQATGVNQPTKSATSFNGHAGVTGDGVTDALALAPVPASFPVGTDDGWIYCVISMPTVQTATVMAYGSSAAGTGRYIQQRDQTTVDGTYLIRASSPTSPSAAYAVLPDPGLPAYGIIFAQWHSNGTVDFWLNGQFIETTAVPAALNTLTSQFRLFAGAGGTAGTPWAGQIAHWAVGTGAPEVSDIQRAMGLGAHWCGLQSFLPDDHPYKTIAPWEI